MGMAGLMGGASGKEVITRMGEEEEGADMEEDLDVEDVKEEGECETRADSDSKVQETACGAVSPASKTKSVWELIIELEWLECKKLISFCLLNKCVWKLWVWR